MKLSDLPPGTCVLLGKAYEYESPYQWVSKDGRLHVGSKGWRGRRENDLMIWDGERLFFVWRDKTSWADGSNEKFGGEVGGARHSHVTWDDECGCWRFG